MSEVQKDELLGAEAEGQEMPETVEVAENAAVVEKTEDLQDEVSDGVAAVLPLVDAKADQKDEEDEREQAPLMTEAA